MSPDRLVYSSDKDVQKKDKNQPKPYTPSSGPCKMRLETKGRGGKSVTVVWNFPFAEAEVRSLMKDLQNKCACGATFKDSRIEFQGDIRNRILEYFRDKSWKLVQAGG